MKPQQIKLMFFFLALISAWIAQPLEAQNDQPITTSLCPKQTALNTVPGCFEAVKLASANVTRFLTRECCQAVKQLPECLLLVFPTTALNTLIFKSICIKKFPGYIL